MKVAHSSLLFFLFALLASGEANAKSGSDYGYGTTDLDISRDLLQFVCDRSANRVAGRINQEAGLHCSQITHSIHLKIASSSDPGFDGWAPKTYPGTFDWQVQLQYECIEMTPAEIAQDIVFDKCEHLDPMRISKDGKRGPVKSRSNADQWKSADCETNYIGKSRIQKDLPEEGLKCDLTGFVIPPSTESAPKANETENKLQDEIAGDQNESQVTGESAR